MKFRYQVLCVLPVLILAYNLLPTSAQAQFTQQGPKLVGTGATGFAVSQGESVSLSGDGNIAIVGGPSIFGNNNGAAWVYTRSRGLWTQQTELIGTGTIGSTVRQGSSVSLSGDGNTAIIGGPGDNNNAGAAWVFIRFGGVWTQQAKLVGTGAIGSVVGQGNSVSLSRDGDTAIVGGPVDNNLIGAAWVFTRSRGVWTQQAKLVGTDIILSINPFVNQGESVSLSADGNTAIVGGPFDNNAIGASWVFTRSRGVWSQQAKLVGTGAITDAIHFAVEQGGSVSLSADGNTAIVGGSLDNNAVGASWVFTRSRGVWSQQVKLVGTGAIGSVIQQGGSVSLSGDGDTATVGGYNDNNAVGAVWVFTRSRGVWNQQTKLVGTGAIGDARQGVSVSLSRAGDTAIVGGPGDNDDAGAAWIFTQRPVFAGMPGKANCHGKSVEALAQQFGGLDAAAAALGFSSVRELQEAILAFCEG